MGSPDGLQFVITQIQQWLEDGPDKFVIPQGLLTSMCDWIEALQELDDRFTQEQNQEINRLRTELEEAWAKYRKLEEEHEIIKAHSREYPV